MALVLRKAVLPKNVSLLKCIKGRNLVTAANKNNPTPLPAGVFRRSLKDAATLKPLGLVKMKTKEQQAATARGRAAARPPTLRRCISCPELVPVTRTHPFIPMRHFSLPRTRPIFYDGISKPKHVGIFHPLLSLATCSLSARSAPLLNTVSPLLVARRGFASKTGPPCCACGCGCGCLPPPSNTQPRCLQFITGYYYYPYGTWFCGPYHVSGLSCPVSCGCCSCGCGCGACGACAKCCTGCITPSAAALLPMSGAAYSTQACPKANPLIYTTAVPKPAKETSIQERNPSTPNPAKSHISTQDALKSTRQGLSKFFPFNSTSVTLTAGGAAATARPIESASDVPKNLWLPYDKDAKNLVHVSKSDASRVPRQSGSMKWTSAPGDSKTTSNSPPFRRFSRLACDLTPSKVSLSPIRHKPPLKRYIWEVVDRPRHTQQRIDYPRDRDSFADRQFKPYKA